MVPNIPEEGASAQGGKLRASEVMVLFLGDRVAGLDINLGCLLSSPACPALSSPQVENLACQVLPGAPGWTSAFLFLIFSPSPLSHVLQKTEEDDEFTHGLGVLMVPRPPCILGGGDEEETWGGRILRSV